MKVDKSSFEKLENPSLPCMNKPVCEEIKERRENKKKVFRHCEAAVTLDSSMKSMKICIESLIICVL
jgi:hypothetical protein